jgi:hypothetical protein
MPVSRAKVFAIITLVPVLLCLNGCTPANRPAPAVRQAATAEPHAGLFEDVTERAGITFRHTNGTDLKYLFLQTVGGGCAFLDYDNDGYLDILLLSCGEFPPSASAPPNLTLYHNNGDGTFTDVTRQAGLAVPLGYAQSVSVGDYDNDGYPDIFVAGYGGCHLFHNELGASKLHAGTDRRQPTAAPQHAAPFFRDVTKEAGVSDTEQGPRWASGAAWGDYDNDGKLDLYIQRRQTRPVYLSLRGMVAADRHQMPAPRWLARLLRADRLHRRLRPALS